MFTVFMLIAVFLFVLAALNFSSPVALQPAGLAFMALAFVFNSGLPFHAH